MSISATEVGIALSNSGFARSICSASLSLVGVALISSAEVGVALINSAEVGVALINSIEVGLALRKSAEVGVPRSMSAGALKRCNSTEVGVALNNSLALIKSEGVVKAPPPAEGVTDLRICSCCCGVIPPRKNISADGVSDRWAWPIFLLKFKEWY